MSRLRSSRAFAILLLAVVSARAEKSGTDQSAPTDACAASNPAPDTYLGSGQRQDSSQPCRPRPAAKVRPATVAAAPSQERIDAARARADARVAQKLRVRADKADEYFDHSVAQAQEELFFSHGSNRPLPKWVYETLSRGSSAPPKPVRRASESPAAAPRTRAEPPFPPQPPPPSPLRPFEEFGRGLQRGVRTVVGGVNNVVTGTTNALLQAGGFMIDGTRQVVNGFFHGIEMVAGAGYTLIHAADRHSNFGTTRLVLGFERIAGYMRSSGIAQTELVIGDMSRWDGGKLGRHLSHRKGIDMDIGYYMVDAQGQPVQGTNLIPLNKSLRGEQGTRKNPQAVYFDAPRNWQLVRAFLSSPDFKVQWIFVAPQIKVALMNEAARIHDPLREDANKVLDINWPGHNSHLHLRVQ